jgi:hypothetical protein
MLKVYVLNYSNYGISIIDSVVFNFIRPIKADNITNVMPTTIFPFRTSGPKARIEKEINCTNTTN